MKDPDGGQGPLGPEGTAANVGQFVEEDVEEFLLVEAGGEVERQKDTGVNGILDSRVVDGAGLAEGGSASHGHELAGQVQSLGGGGIENGRGVAKPSVQATLAEHLAYREAEHAQEPERTQQQGQEVARGRGRGGQGMGRMIGGGGGCLASTGRRRWESRDGGGSG